MIIFLIQKFLYGSVKETLSLFSALLLIALCSLVASCDWSPSKDPQVTIQNSEVSYYEDVHSIIIQPGTAKIKIGEYKWFTASVYDRKGKIRNDISVSWHITDPMIAGISSEGVAEGLSQGRVTVYATLGTIESAHATLEVAPDTNPPVFYGCSKWAQIDEETISLFWQPATDDVSSQAKIIYKIYGANEADKIDFSSPFMPQVQGTSWAIVPGLQKSIPYFFVVRASDEFGNEDQNETVCEITTRGKYGEVVLEPFHETELSASPTVLVSDPRNVVYIATSDKKLAVLDLRNPLSPNLGEKETIISTAASGTVLKFNTSNGNEPVYTYYLALSEGLSGVYLYQVDDPNDLLPPMIVRAMETGEKITAVSQLADGFSAISDRTLYRILYDKGTGEGGSTLQNSGDAFTTSDYLPLLGGNKLLVSSPEGDKVAVIFEDGLVELFVADNNGNLLPLNTFEIPAGAKAAEWSSRGVTLAYPKIGLVTFSLSGANLMLAGTYTEIYGFDTLAISSSYIADWDKENGELKAFRRTMQRDSELMGVRAGIAENDLISIAGGMILQAKGKLISLYNLPPFVKSVSLNEANTKIEISVSKPVVSSTVSGETVSLFSVSGGQEEPVPALITLENEETILIEPIGDVNENVTFLVNISGGICDLLGTCLFPPGGEKISFSEPLRAPDDPYISQLSHQQIEPGGTLIIYGGNFSLTASENQVYFSDKAGKYTVEAETILNAPTSNTLYVIVPDGAQTGKILLRTSHGMAISGESIYIMYSPTITRVSPEKGPVGSTITITGTHFGVRESAPLGFFPVSINGIEMPIVDYFAGDPHDDTIIALIPEKASSAPIKVTTLAGTAVSGDFIVVPKPAVLSISPQSGRVGSEVTITGKNFGEDPGNIWFSMQAGYSGISAEVKTWSDNEVVATVPDHAINGRLKVATSVPGVSADTETDFIVYYQPSISSVTPVRGGAGETTITINGSAFNSVRGEGKAGIGDAEMGIVSWEDAKITASVPSLAEAGPISVLNGGAYQANGPQFYVMKITSVEPKTAVGGSAITVLGENFGQTTGQVYVGSRLCQVQDWKDVKITFALPTDAESGAVKISAEGGGFVTGTEIQVTPRPTISAIQPLRAGAGNDVTITGSGFGQFLFGHSQVIFENNISAEIKSWNSTTVVVRVPDGASDGTISLITGDDIKTVSQSTFLVMKFAINEPFSPTSGTANTQVKIYGRNFGTLAGSVYIGGQQALVEAWGDTEITARAGPSTYDAPVTVTAPEGGTITSSIDFITLAPVITSVDPSRAGPGMKVTIRGRNFQGQTGNSRISAGGIVASIERWDYYPENIVVFIVPNNPAFTDDITIRAASGKSTTLPGTFTYVPAPNISSVSPADAPVKFHHVSIQGANFQTVGLGTQVCFKSGTSCTSVIETIIESSNKLLVAPPTVTTGLYQVVVTTDGGEATAATQVTLFNTPQSAELSPPNALVGEALSIDGGDFEPSDKNNLELVFDDNILASVLTTSVSQITLNIPIGAENGPVSITTRAGSIDTEWFFVKKLRASFSLGASTVVSDIEPANNLLFILDSSQPSVILFDGASETISDVYDTSLIGNSPKSLAYCADDNYLGVSQQTETVRIINAATKTLLHNVTVSASATINDIACDNDYLYVLYRATDTNNYIERISLATGALSGTPLAMPQGNPKLLLLSSALVEGFALFASNLQVQTPFAQPFSTATFTISRPKMNISGDPAFAAIDAQGDRLFTARNSGNYVDVLDIKGVDSGTVNSILLPAQPYGLAISADGDYLNASMPTLGAMAIIDVDDFEGTGSDNPNFLHYLGKISLGSAGRFSACLPASVVGAYHHLYIANSGNTLSALDCLTTFDTPKIYTISPTSATIGDTVTITGTNFKNSQPIGAIVTIGGVNAGTITQWTNTQIKAVIPAGAQSGKRIHVVTDGGNTRSARKLQIN